MNIQYMHHLFIINPIAAHVRGRVREISGEIESFFRGMGMDNYRIHVTRWARDGMGYVNHVARSSPEPVRVHSMGGSGTLYETVNGTIGLPNVQIAAYPMGDSNFFIRYFGRGREHNFRSLGSQVFSDVTPIDAMRGEVGCGVGFSVIGLEAVADRDGSEILEKADLPAGLCYLYTTVKAILKAGAICQRYEIEIDGKDYGGEYVSILVAGVPCYGSGMTPAPEAHPNDGIMDIYLIKKMSAVKLLSVFGAYTSGNHEKMGGAVIHARGKKITVSGEKDIVMSLDGEWFYDRSVSYEIIPAAIDFVCPSGIDVSKLPRVYTRPGEGAVGDQPPH